ncbi:hypothetical protein ABZ896_03425 [Streptomyces sp. NPDC047072]|uniref:hypothetical protein n=1 Tax=Streptomyces sp. NPDC047072 TaxID=3154809 RepID=UPI0033DF15D6
MNDQLPPGQEQADSADNRQHGPAPVTFHIINNSGNIAANSSGFIQNPVTQSLPVTPRRPTGWGGIRGKPKRVTVRAVALLLVALGMGGDALTDTDPWKDRHVEVNGSPSGPAPSEGPSKGSPSPTASRTPSASSPGYATSLGTEPASDARSGSNSGGTTGSASGDTGSGATSGSPRSSGGSSGDTSGNTGPSTSGGTTTPDTQPYIDATIEWSNDEVGSTDDPKDPSAIVKVYDTYEKGAGTSVHAYYRTAKIRVKCQVTGGRVIDLGDEYKGPEPPQRDGIWYRMDSGEWAPAVYVSTGKDSLPTCSAGDS